MISKEESLIMGARFRKSKSQIPSHNNSSYSFPAIVIGRKSLQKFANFYKENLWRNKKINFFEQKNF